MEAEKNIVPGYSGKQISIIEAAERLFANKGFEGTSVRDIALDAAVNVAMISYYFGSKEKLLDAIVSYRISSGALLLENLLQNKDLDPIQKLHLLVDSYVDRMMSNPCFHKIIIRQQIAGAASTINASFAESKLRSLEMVRKLINEGVRKKVFNKTTDVQLLMATLIGTVYQALSQMEFYMAAGGNTEMTAEQFEVSLRKKLKIHLKHLLISALTYEV